MESGFIVINKARGLVLYSIENLFVDSQSQWSIATASQRVVSLASRRVRSCQATALHQGDHRPWDTLRCVAGAYRPKRATS